MKRGISDVKKSYLASCVKTVHQCKECRHDGCMDLVLLHRPVGANTSRVALKYEVGF